MPTLTVGLTGGIGSGKSTAAALLQSFGVPVVDLDAISRSLTLSGGRAVPAIAKAFGTQMIDEFGAMDRAKMRDLVFKDSEARIRLEHILHPMIRDQAQESLESVATSAPYVVIDSPLLLESRLGLNFINRILVIDVTPATQIARVKARSGLSHEQIQAIINAQCPRALRIARANDVIINEGNLNEFAERIKTLHKKYLSFVDAVHTS